MKSKEIKRTLLNYTCGIVLLASITSVRAQSTWNYIISDAGDGNSLVTWSVTGALATSPGAATLPSNGAGLTVSIVAPGIFVGSYQADGTIQTISTPDGSYFDLDDFPDAYAAIVGYATDIAAGGGNDSFSLYAPVPPRINDLLYVPGTQSVIIPVDFSDFNPGTYQSQDSEFSPSLTVNLTVVPEPSMTALAVGAGIMVALSKRPNIQGKKGSG